MLKRVFCNILLLTAITFFSAHAQTPMMRPPGVKAVFVGDSVKAPGRPQSVGLVLSGGGAKGVAHVGVIKALEENNIPIDYIAGTSMGSIIGGLYAMGYTPEEMMQLLLSKDFSYWSTGRIDPNEVYFFSRNEPTPAILTLPISSKKQPKDGGAPASLINPLPMNFAFMELFSAYTAQCGSNFDNLFVPFRCVASDVDAARKVVHRSGSLGDAIRTSMSFPLVFQPIRMNGALLYDGGIYDNFPVDVMIEDFAPDIIIGVDVSSSKEQDPNSLFSQIENLVMRKQSYAVPPERGIKLKVDVDKFALLDFPAAQDIYNVGYATAMGMMDSICGRVTSRISPVTRATRRGEFKSATPYVHFDSIDVHGGTPRQQRFIKYVFEPADADTFGLAHARESFYRAITPGRLQDLLPTAIPDSATGMFTLRLDAVPKRNMHVGIGGYVTSSTNSFLYLSAGYKTLSFSSVAADVQAWIGQSYMAGVLSASVNLPTRIPSNLGLMAVAQRSKYNETDKMFFDNRQPSFLVGHEYFGRLTYALAAGPRAKVELGIGYGHLNNSFYRPDVTPDKSARRDHTAGNLGQIRAGLSSSTLDNIIYPTTGLQYKITAMALTGTERFHSAADLFPAIDKKPSWWQAEAAMRKFMAPSRYFSLGLEADALYSSRPLTGNYNADIVDAHAFAPTPALEAVFNRSLRANSYVALGLVPVYKYNSSLSARINAHVFMPMRAIVDQGNASHYGRWFGTARFVGQIDITYTLPVNATVSAYANYVSAGSRPWGLGLTIGTYIAAPRFLR